MKVCKESGYIIGISEDCGENISDLEYEAIMSAIEQRPVNTDGVIYRLSQDSLEWVAIPFNPVLEEENNELTAEEALSFLLGGDINV